LRIMQLIFAAAAAVAMLAFFNAARPDTTGTMLGSVHLTDVTIASPLPETPPGLAGGGLATDDGSDQAQLQQQQAQQEMQQAEQQAEQQNEAAQQQALQDELQGQQVQQQAGNP
jgi:hypothetical protein